MSYASNIICNDCFKDGKTPEKSQCKKCLTNHSWRCHFKLNGLKNRLKHRKCPNCNNIFPSINDLRYCMACKKGWDSYE